MRSKFVLLAFAIVAAVATPAAASGSVTLSAPASLSKADGPLVISGTATFPGVAPGRIQVFEDPTGDDQVLEAATPAEQDLVAGSSRSTARRRCST